VTDPSPAADAADTICDVAIVGAGIAGLCAAGELIAVGRRVLVLEKSRGVGGRMATRRLGEAVCDHGAQFFTVRGRAFGGLVTEAHDAGAVTTWCDGFPRATSAAAAVTPAADGHPRWRGVRGMTDLPKRLAAVAVGRDHPGRCDIRTGVRVATVGAADPSAGKGGVSITLDDGPPLWARAAVLTCPVPQALDLLAGGSLDEAAREELARVAYDPCFALMLELARPSGVPPPGAIQFAPDTTGSIAWLADNFQKGISPVPAVTVHATAAFSRAHFDAPPDEVAAALLDAIRPWVAAADVVASSLQRWKFSHPTVILEQPLVAARLDPPIVCCGDAFGGPKVEGAAASGLAAGRWLARILADREAAVR
jgi:renalase